jgi:hypothetical protein
MRNTFFGNDFSEKNKIPVPVLNPKAFGAAALPLFRSALRQVAPLRNCFAQNWVIPAVGIG